MTVAQRITDYWPVTERKLISENAKTDYTASKPRQITEAIRRLYRKHAAGIAIPLSVDGNDDVEAYVAAQALLLLLPSARDYFKDGYLSRSLSAENGGGSGSESLYNVMDVLNELETTAEEDLQAALPWAIAIINPPSEDSVLSGSAPTVRRNASNLFDPLERAKQR